MKLPSSVKRDAGLESDFFEFVSQVVEERIIGGVVGDEQVGPAVQIVVGHAYAHAFADVARGCPILSKHPRNVPSPLFRNNWLGWPL